MSPEKYKQPAERALEAVAEAKRKKEARKKMAIKIGKGAIGTGAGAVVLLGAMEPAFDSDPTQEAADEFADDDNRIVIDGSMPSQEVMDFEGNGSVTLDEVSEETEQRGAVPSEESPLDIEQRGAVSDQTRRPESEPFELKVEQRGAERPQSTTPERRGASPPEQQDQ